MTALAKRQCGPCNVCCVELKIEAPQLRKKARSMNVDPVRLARDLLETIVADDLYNAVLDLENENA